MIYLENFAGDIILANYPWK